MRGAGPAERTRPHSLTRLEAGSQPGMGLSTAYPRQEPWLRPQKKGTTLVGERGKQAPLALSRASLPPRPTHCKGLLEQSIAQTSGSLTALRHLLQVALVTIIMCLFSRKIAYYL